MRYVLAVLLAVILVACSTQPDVPVCSAPYTLSDGKCCLDADNNSACDAKVVTQEKLDCSLCPPQFVIEKQEVEVLTYKYVCFNQSIVDKPEQCGSASNAKLFKPYRFHNETLIEDFDARPACRGKFNVAEVHLEYYEPPTGITLQILSEPDGQFQDIAKPPVVEFFYYIGFCKDCQGLVDLALEPDQAYLVRAVLHYKDGDVYTREELIDPTPSGDIGSKSC